MKRSSRFPERRNLALPGYDYRTPNSYFVTVRAYRGEHVFGAIVKGEVRLNGFGRIVEEEWLRTPILRPLITLDAYVVMPNHFHAILEIRPSQKPEGSILEGLSGPTKGSLSAVMGQFKMMTSKRCRASGHTNVHPLWLRRWYDRVIRSDSEKADIRRYIGDNPIRWEQRRALKAGHPLTHT